MRRIATLPIALVLLAWVWPALSKTMPSDAELTKIAQQAEQFYTKREKEAGLLGLKGDVVACYSHLGKDPAEAKVAYCIALDDITTASNVVWGAGAEKFFPYFSTKEFNARAVQAVQTIAGDRDAFRKRVIALADPGAKRAAQVQINRQNTPFPPPKKP